MKNELNNTTDMLPKGEDEQNKSSISRRTALKYLGVGALGTLGAIYGVSQPALAKYVPNITDEISPGFRGGISAANAKNKSMKVVLVNGSPRKNGNTFTALSEVAKTLEEEGVTTHIVQLGMQALQGCI